jgi:hypothetical protein
LLNNFTLTKDSIYFLISYKGKLEQHFASDAHKSSVDKYLNFKNKKVNIDLILDSNRMKEVQEQDMILQLNKQVIITLLDSARYLARQGLAFRRNPDSEGYKRKIFII